MQSISWPPETNKPKDGVGELDVALGSICLVSKKPMLWYLSLALAVLATGKMIYVWLT
jgi:hypothetical protein